MYREMDLALDFAKLFGTGTGLDVRDFCVAKTSGIKICLNNFC